jgi:hypothetical protein
MSLDPADTSVCATENQSPSSTNWVFAERSQFDLELSRISRPAGHDFTRKAGMMAQCTRGTLLFHLYHMSFKESAIVTGKYLQMREIRHLKKVPDKLDGSNGRRPKLALPDQILLATVNG